MRCTESFVDLSRPVVRRRPSRPILCVALVLILTGLLLAQGAGSLTGRPPSAAAPPMHPQPSDFDQQHVQLRSSGSIPDSLGERDTCLLPPLAAIQLPTVGVADLKIAPKAKKQYAAGCAALKDSKYDKAEESLRKAVGAEPKYVAAWVTLGQLLAGRQKLEDARQACSQAQTADPKYVPSYLCLADIAARSQNWAETLNISGQALQIDSANNPVAYDYSAAASLNLHKLDDAEKSALKAIEIDRNHVDSRVHFLLAQIYEAKGQRAKEEAELREYLKYADANDAAMVKEYLSQMEAQPK
jgi:tetratricopeptide (TPR) repeat protein